MEIKQPMQTKAQAQAHFEALMSALAALSSKVNISNSRTSDSMIAAPAPVAEDPTSDSVKPSPASCQSPNSISNHGSSCYHQLSSLDLPPPTETVLAPHKVPPDPVEQLYDVAQLLSSILKPTPHLLGFHFFQRPIFAVSSLRLLLYDNCAFLYLWQRPVFAVPSFRLLLYNTSCCPHHHRLAPNPGVLTSPPRPAPVRPRPPSTALT